MRTVAIARQGGGSHTAFAGGALQGLLTDGDHRVVALSGTSGPAGSAGVSAAPPAVGLPVGVR